MALKVLLVRLAQPAQRGRLVRREIRVRQVRKESKAT